jgi:uncharacterized repeat protein (TIGR03833 family)
MFDFTQKSNIKEGLRVIIQEFPDQKETEYSEGIITGILSREDFVPEGIRVLLDNGSIGHVKDLVQPQNSVEIIKKRLLDRENQFVEKKSSFAYDINLNKKNEYLQTVAAIAVASFMNSEGGFVYIGVSDDGTPLGLDSDYSLISSRPNNDGLEEKIKQSFLRLLDNQIELQQCLSFNFPVIDDKEICEIHVKPAKKPIFLKAKKCTVVIDDEHKPQRWIEDFYIRNGNSHYLIEKNSELYEYFFKRFFVN